MAAEGHQDYPHELVESIEMLSRLVLTEEDISSTMQRIAELTVHAVEGAEEGSVSLARGDEIVTLGATADVCRQIDELQYETGQGPCLSSIKEHETFRIPDMETDHTWPEFSKRAAAETDIKSMLSFVLDLREGTLGAVNLMSTDKDSFDDDDVATGAIFAAQAAIALANAVQHDTDLKHIEQFEAGLQTRQLIGQAVGLVMAAHRVNADDAFDILVRVSQTSNVKVREIAQRVVDNPPEG
ncbi:MAG: ANTAR domain-containing protein [Actinomycetota bacterium]